LEAEIKSRALCMLGKGSTTESHPSALSRTLLIKLFSFLLRVLGSKEYSIGYRQVRLLLPVVRGHQFIHYYFYKANNILYYYENYFHFECSLEGYWKAPGPHDHTLKITM
jgi:hypothetical protein